MRRFLTLLSLFLIALPVGLSISGCTTKVENYCNNAGYGPKLTDINNVTLGPATTGISLAYGQISQASTPRAFNCKNTALSPSTYTYGSTNIQLADINPGTGAICAGTWNRLSAGGIPDFTICTPPSGPGTAQITASSGGVASNPVTVYIHPPISSITIPTQTACVSHNQQLTDPTTGQPVPLTAGTVVYDTSGNPIPSQYVGNITYTAVTPSIVTINNTSVTSSTDTTPSTIPNGQATANLPGATVVTASVSLVSSAAGYFFTCPPASITASINGSTSATVNNGNPQAITTVVSDTNGQLISGANLDFTSTQPLQVSVTSAGSVSAAYAATATVSAICQPSTCNPAPLEKIGVFGTGLPIVSNPLAITSPGTSSTLLWLASPQSQFFTPVDLSLGTAGTPIRLPYLPNSMVLDPTGASLYFGNNYELMIYAAGSNTLSKQDPSVPGVVLAAAPDNSSVVINDQLRQVIYIYSPSTGGNISIGGLATRAAYSRDGKNVYVVGPTNLYVHNNATGWSVYPLPADELGTSCSVQNDLNNNGLNPFCSPDVALTVPAVAPFISGAQTTAHSFCPNTAYATSSGLPPYYPQAATITAATEHLAATNDGFHVIGASAANLTDIQFNTPNPQVNGTARTVPIGTCPAVTGPPLALTTTFNQLPFTGITPTQIHQVLISPDSTQTFITYGADAATGLLPLYLPSTTAWGARHPHQHPAGYRRGRSRRRYLQSRRLHLLCQHHRRQPCPPAQHERSYGQAADQPAVAERYRQDRSSAVPRRSSPPNNLADTGEMKCQKARIFFSGSGPFFCFGKPAAGGQHISNRGRD